MKKILTIIIASLLCATIVMAASYVITEDTKDNEDIQKIIEKTETIPATEVTTTIDMSKILSEIRHYSGDYVTICGMLNNQINKYNEGVVGGKLKQKQIDNVVCTAPILPLEKEL